MPATLTAIGQGSQQEALDRYAHEKGVSVVWKGTVPQSELSDELGKHQVFVLPSLYEGSPKTLLEAMACGLPCVATDVTGSKEVLRDGENGVLAQPTAESIRQALEELLSNAELREKLGANARKTILETYSFEKVFETELSVYTALQ
jgi:glycosyltransferase involved in cell wall biosynthesis